MPYLTQDDKIYLDKPGNSPYTEGHWNYLYCKAYLDFWNREGNQRYKNIHKIGKASIYPDVLPEVKAVEARLESEGVPLVDRNIARGCAWQEFYDRVGAFYERLARMKNGDLEEFRIALKNLEEMVKQYLAGTPS